MNAGVRRRALSGRDVHACLLRVLTRAPRAHAPPEARDQRRVDSVGALGREHLRCGMLLCHERPPGHLYATAALDAPARWITLNLLNPTLPHHARKSAPE